MARLQRQMGWGRTIKRRLWTHKRAFTGLERHKGTSRFLASLGMTTWKIAPLDGAATKARSRKQKDGSSIKNVENDRKGEGLAGFRPRVTRGRGFLRGFVPARRGPFVSAKGPKTIGARTWPQGDAFAPVPTVRAAELASLRQSSPPTRSRDRGVATPAGAMGWRGYKRRKRPGEK